LGLGPQDFERYQEDQRNYLVALKSEPPELVPKINYVKALKTLDTELCVIID
jgi:hypothetical protein